MLVELAVAAFVDCQTFQIPCRQLPGAPAEITFKRFEGCVPPPEPAGPLDDKSLFCWDRDGNVYLYQWSVREKGTTDHE